MKKYTKKEFLLVTYLILISGCIILDKPIITGLTGVIFLLYSFIFRKDYKRRTQLWLYLLFLCLIFIGQYFTFNYISFLGSMNVLAKVITGSTIMWMLRERFKIVYLDVIYFFSAVSLVFFTLECIGIKTPDLFPTTPNRNSILIFNSLNIQEMRNCGPFWEPGAFACYLMLVPLLYIGNLKLFVTQNKKKAIVLLIALITTFSTTGYICLFTLVIYYYMTQTRNKFVSYAIYLPLIIGALVYAYNNLDFMGAKMQEQTEYSLEQNGEFSNTRLGSLMFDMHYIKKHPIIGNGLNERTRYADHPFLWGTTLGHGNAFSNYTAQMGIIALLLYFIMLYKAFGNRLIVPIIVALLFQGEQLMNYPIYPSLPFIILGFKNYISFNTQNYENLRTIQK